MKKFSHKFHKSSFVVGLLFLIALSVSSVARSVNSNSKTNTNTSSNTSNDKNTNQNTNKNTNKNNNTTETQIQADSLSDQNQDTTTPLYPVSEIPDFNELLVRKIPADSQEFTADKEIKWDRSHFSLDLIENAYVKSNLNTAYARGSINVKYHTEKQSPSKQTINVIDTVKLNDGVRFQTEQVIGSGDKGVWSVADHKVHLAGKNATLQITTNHVTIVAQNYFDYNTTSGLFQAVGDVRALSDGRIIQANELTTTITPIEVLKTGKVQENHSKSTSTINLNQINAIGNVKINTDAQQITGHKATFNIKDNIVKVDGHAKIIRYPTPEEFHTYKQRKNKTKGVKPENRIIQADHIVGYLTKNNGGKSTQGIDKVTAIGHVQYKNANQTVIGSSALYHPNRGEAYIYDVIAYRGGDSIKACMAYVNLKTTLTEVGPCDRKYGKNNHKFNRKLRKKGKKVDSKDQVVIELSVNPTHTKELNKSLHKQLPLPNFDTE